jgi:predicted Zn-dependent protease
VSLVLCLAAVLRVAIRRNHADPEAIAMAATSPRPTPAPVAAAPAQPTAERLAAEPPRPSDPAADPAVAPSEPKADEPQPPAPASAPTTTTEPAVAAATDTASPSADPAATPEAPAEPDPKAAKKEKLASQIALERGKNDLAIESGERSVKLDPTDGEAWLILGAAYQAKGKGHDARRCFTACLKEGKRGPKSECAAMLR